MFLVAPYRAKYTDLLNYLQTIMPYATHGATKSMRIRNTSRRISSRKSRIKVNKKVGKREIEKLGAGVGVG